MEKHGKGEKHRTKSKTVLYFVLAFILPVVIMLFAYRKMEVYPFGERSLLSMDLWGQYYPMIKGYVNDIKGGFSSDAWSWDGALGFNLVTQNLYYCNSIFYKFLVFFGGEHFVDGIDFILLIKFGFYAVAFLAFLKYKFKDINLMSVAFSVAYSLCSYAVAYVNQPMWTDSIILLPLVVIGIERLVFEKKPVFYTLILAYTIYSNFYISFSICLFSAVYFLVCVGVSDLKGRDILKTAGRFALHSMLAGGVIAYCVLTILSTLAQRNPDPSELGNLKFYYGLPEVLGATFVDTKLSYEYFVPNIYSGIFTIPFIGLFFGSKNINVKKKIVYAVLIIFMFLSVDFNLFDYIWHGFHFPNQLPGRWTFIFSFVLLMTAYEGIKDIKNINIVQFLLSVALFIFVYFVGIHSSELADAVLEKQMTVYFSIAYIFLFLVIFLVSMNWEKGKTYFIKFGGVAMAVVIVVEMNINAVYTSRLYLRTGENKSNYFFDESMEKIRPLLDEDTDFFRTEMNTGWTFNSGQFYDYRGISYYSSTMNGGVYNLLEKLGNRVYANNVSSVYNSKNTFNNSILGVKYIIDRAKNINDPNYDIIMTDDNFNLLKNKSCLPVAFPVDNTAEFWGREALSPMELQNDFIRRAVGKSENTVCEKIEPTTFNISNAEDEKGVDWFNRHYIRTKKDMPVVFEFEYDIKKDGNYTVQHNFRAGEITIQVPGREYNIDFNEPVCQIDKLNSGDKVRITVRTEGINYGLWNMDLYLNDNVNLGDTVETLKKGGFVAEEVKQNKLTGTVTAENHNQLFFTSIPNDGGWSVYCDGEKIKIVEIADSLIGFRTPQGEHTIKFVYHSKGFLPGLVIAVISLIVLVWVNYGEKFKKKKDCSF